MQVIDFGKWLFGMNTPFEQAAINQRRPTYPSPRDVTTGIDAARAG
jgi:hypothetical protein